MGMPLTRRVTRQIVGSLASVIASRQEQQLRTSAAVSDINLATEHTQTVAEAMAKGTIKKNIPRKPLATAPKLPREHRIEQRSDGSIGLVLNNGEQTLTLVLLAHGIHAMLSILLEVSQGAGWDFPPISEWLDTARRQQAAPADKVVH